MTFSCAHWQNRLDALRAAHRVPGATLAVFTEGKIHELASGILHRGTGVEATTDSVFHLGSMAQLENPTLVNHIAPAGAKGRVSPAIAVGAPIS
ncbi:penicillin-binding protein, partial [Streptomyces sp. NPDC059538]